MLHAPRHRHAPLVLEEGVDVNTVSERLWARVQLSGRAPQCAQKADLPLTHPIDFFLGKSKLLAVARSGG
jgi:hypothetical protein